MLLVFSHALLTLEWALLVEAHFLLPISFKLALPNSTSISLMGKPKFLHLVEVRWSMAAPSTLIMEEFK